MPDSLSGYPKVIAYLLIVVPLKNCGSARKTLGGGSTPSWRDYAWSSGSTVEIKDQEVSPRLRLLDVWHPGLRWLMLFEKMPLYKRCQPYSRIIQCDASRKLCRVPPARVCKVKIMEKFGCPEEGNWKKIQSLHVQRSYFYW